MLALAAVAAVFSALGAPDPCSAQAAFDVAGSGRFVAVAGVPGPAGWSGTLLDLSLQFDAAGRVDTRQDGAAAGATEEYGYDLLGRLDQVGGASAGYSRGYGYDALGNLDWSSLQDDLFGDGQYSYGDAGPHAVSGIGAHTTLEYDASGALTERTRTGPDDYARSYIYGSDGALRSSIELPSGGSGLVETHSVLGAQFTIERPAWSPSASSATKRNQYSKA